MKRFYYLTDSIESTDIISKDLHEAGITDWHFHVLSKNEAGLYKHHLNSANLLQRTDLIRFIERGIIVGGLMSLCFTIPLHYIEEFTFEAWLSISVFSMLFAAWCAGVGGISRENYKIERFHDAIEHGQFLIMVDVKRRDENIIRKLMQRRHPEAVLQGFDSTITNPFSTTLEPVPVKH